MTPRIVFLSIAFASTLFASDFVCVRNDLKSGMGFCEGELKGRWAYFYNADPDAKFEVCAEKHAASMCASAPRNFVWAETQDGDKACVLNNNVDDFDMCAARPVQYNYILTEKPTY